MTGYSAEAQAVIAAITAGDVCPDCNAPNHLRHFDDCPRHPENLTGAPAARLVDALTGEVAAAGAERPVVAYEPLSIAAQQHLQAERDQLFEQRDTWMQTTYRFARLDIETRRQLAVAERDAEELREENASLRARLDELKAEVRELRAGQAVSS